MKKIIQYLATVIWTTVVLTVLYFIWTRNTNTSDLIVFGMMAILVALIFGRAVIMPSLHPKTVAYFFAYVFYLIYQIIKSNLDVAARVIKPQIPINPGIVKVKTRLKSPVGRMVLANSITLTPGTLTVDIKGQELFIHWIDVTNVEEEAATKEIVEGFEKFLEVIFG